MTGSGLLTNVRKILDTTAAIPGTLDASSDREATGSDGPITLLSPPVHGRANIPCDYRHKGVLLNIDMFYLVLVHKLDSGRRTR